MADCSDNIVTVLLKYFDITFHILLYLVAKQNIAVLRKNFLNTILEGYAA